MRYWLGIGAAIVLGLAMVGVANALVLRGGRGLSRGAIKEPDCVLVLGAGLTPDGRPSGVLEDRLEEALAIYNAGRTKKILVSGDHARPEYDEVNAMRVWLEERGVPRADIFLDHAGFDTYSSIWRAKHVFGAERIIVVTQRFHLARALWVARAIGMDAEGSAADRHVYAAGRWFAAREVISRTKAVVDIAVRRSPRHAGPKIDLDGDGSQTEG